MSHQVKHFEFSLGVCFVFYCFIDSQHRKLKFYVQSLGCRISVLISMNLQIFVEFEITQVLIFGGTNEQLLYDSHS